MSIATEKGFTEEAIEWAKVDCIRWLKYNDHDWVMPWDNVNVDVYNKYSLAPPIAGYEALESEGVVVNRGLVDAGAGKRIQFDKVLKIAVNGIKRGEKPEKTEPCGECYLKDGETCDICGFVN